MGAFARHVRSYGAQALCESFAERGADEIAGSSRASEEAGYPVGHNRACGGVERPMQR